MFNIISSDKEGENTMSCKETNDSKTPIVTYNDIMELNTRDTMY
jgi:hypothetical protein